MHHLVIVVLCVLAVNTICQVSTKLSEEARVECNDTIEGRGVEDVEYHAPKESGIPELAGVKGVWWPGSHAISSWWSLLAAGLSSVAIGTAVLPAARRMDTVEDRVFRGVEAEPYAWPWIAKIKTTFRKRGARVRKRACGGALIADRFVITARHCVSWDSTGVVVDGRMVELWLGSHGREGQDGLKVPVRRILVRPDYQAPTCASGVWCPEWAFWSHRILTNDIALLELMRPAPPSPKISSISLAGNPPGPGVTAWVGGWGLDGKYPTPMLNLAPMAVQRDNFQQCRQQMAPGKMCAIGKDLGGPCPGDSGSPLVVYSRSNGPTLVGLVSNGAESCRDGLPGIFTRVSYYLDWIYLAMDKARIIRPHFQTPRRRRRPHEAFVPRLRYKRRFERLRSSHEGVPNLSPFYSKSKEDSYSRYKHFYS